MSSFTDFCTDYFKKYFDLHPTEAIYYGIEGYDHLLNDYSDETYKTEKAFVGESLDKLQQIPVEHLDEDQAIDYALLEGRLTIQRYEYEKEDFRLKWPDTYLPVDAIYILTVRRPTIWPANLLSRLNRKPGLIQQGIANLSRPDANPPRLWTEMAIEAAKGGLSFLDNSVDPSKGASDRLKILKFSRRPLRRRRVSSGISPCSSNGISFREAAASMPSAKSTTTCCLKRSIS